MPVFIDNGIYAGLKVSVRGASDGTTGVLDLTLSAPAAVCGRGDRASLRPCPHSIIAINWRGPRARFTLAAHGYTT